MKSNSNVWESSAVLAACIAIILAVALFGCARELSEPGNGTEEGTESFDFYRDYTGTGLPGDHLGYYLLYVNGDLHMLDLGDPAGYLEELPEGFSLFGTVQDDDFYTVPKKELSACHIEKGTRVYTNPDDISAVYVERKYDDGRVGYYLYKLCRENDYSLISRELERLRELKNK